MMILNDWKRIGKHACTNSGAAQTFLWNRMEGFDNWWSQAWHSQAPEREGEHLLCQKARRLLGSAYLFLSQLLHLNHQLLILQSNWSNWSHLWFSAPSSRAMCMQAQKHEYNDSWKSWQVSESDMWMPWRLHAGLFSFLLDPMWPTHCGGIALLAGDGCCCVFYACWPPLAIKNIHWYRRSWKIDKAFRCFGKRCTTDFRWV